MGRIVIGSVVLASLFLLAACTKEAGMPRNTLATPAETVTIYCGLDADGARLTSATWSKVLPYIAWSEEAGFDRAVVISGFTVGQTRMQGEGRAIVPVQYQVLGTVAGEYRAERRNETVTFLVARTDRGWKIVEPESLLPHVRAQAMVNHLEGTQQSEMAEKIRSDQ